MFEPQSSSKSLAAKLVDIGTILDAVGADLTWIGENTVVSQLPDVLFTPTVLDLARNRRGSMVGYGLSWVRRSTDVGRMLDKTEGTRAAPESCPTSRI